MFTDPSNFMLFYSGLNFTPSSKCVTTMTQRRERETEREREDISINEEIAPAV
jgi:hypothetical protein